MSAPDAEPALADRFRRLIAQHGPMPVSRYMGESNARYYASRDPLGSAGDFTTAPEISQMFGEMIGLWIADLWQRSGMNKAAYVELGPGRGTLASDALRALASQERRPDVHFIEGSEALRKAQSKAVSSARFHDTLDTLPDNRPIVLVANEFLDALPIRQLVKTPEGWRERMVALEGEDFLFVAGPNPMDEAMPDNVADASVGTVVETCPAAAAIIGDIAQRIARSGGAALIIDYGHLDFRTGETLQALRRHRKVALFEAPGDMDLTAHVDFATLREVAEQEGVRVHTAEQGAFLNALGMAQRAAMLAKSQPAHAQAIETAHHRLTHADEMGSLFKVLCLTRSDAPVPAGFGQGSSAGQQSGRNDEAKRT